MAGEDLAGIGARFGATLIDLVPVLVVVGIIATRAGLEISDASYVGAATSLVVGLIYAALLCRRGPHNGQTPGKQLVGIRVVRADAQPMDATPALLREFVGKGILGQIPLFAPVDYLFALGDRRRQTIHDKIATTFVVRADAVPDLGPDAPSHDAFLPPTT